MDAVCRTDRYVSLWTPSVSQGFINVSFLKLMLLFSPYELMCLILVSCSVKLVGKTLHSLRVDLPTVHSSGTNLGTLRCLCCKILLLDFNKKIDISIKLNELYISTTVEKHLQKKLSIFAGQASQRPLQAVDIQNVGRRQVGSIYC